MALVLILLAVKLQEHNYDTTENQLFFLILLP